MLDSLKKKALHLTGGTLLSQALALAFIPILTRIYSVEQFGEYSLFIGITAFLSSVFFWKLELAIPISRNSEIRERISGVLFLFGFLTAVIFLFSWNLFLGSSQESLLASLAIVLGAAFLAGNNALQIVASRRGETRVINSAKIIRTLFLGGSQSLIHFFSSFGLVIGEVLSRLLGVIYFLGNIELRVRFSSRYLLYFLRKHINLIKYSVLAGFFNSAVVNSMSLVVLPVYGKEVAGMTFIVQRLAALPVGLIGQSVSLAYIGSISVEILNKNYESILHAIRTASKVFFLIGIPAFSVAGTFLYLFEEVLFGKEWVGMYRIFLILSPVFVFQLAYSSFSQSLNVLGLQRSQLFWDLARFSLVFLALIAPQIIDVESSFTWAISLYSVVMSCMYFLQYRMVIKRLEFLSREMRVDGRGEK